jgi:hypothetical protein
MSLDFHPGFGIVLASGHTQATGTSLLFFAALILQVLLGLAVFSYAAHSFLTIVVDTAAGTDQIRWPAEPFTDWLWKPWYLAWLVAFWMAPLGLVLALFKFTAMQIALLGLILFWIVFPVGLLSSLSATSRWMVFRPVIVWCMLRYFGTTLVFFVATELLLAAWGATVYYTWRHFDWMLLMPLTALVAAAVLFLYGRLAGRLAWVINQRKLGKQEELEGIAAEAEVQDPWGAPANVVRDGEESQPRANVEDPWAVPPQEEDPDYWKKGLPLEVQMAGRYDIQTKEPPPAPAPKPQKTKTRKPAVYAAQPVSAEKPERAPVVHEVSKKELDLIERKPEAPPPAWPMFSGVYTFLGYPATIAPLLAVALGLWLMGLILRFQISILTGR